MINRLALQQERQWQKIAVARAIQKVPPIFQPKQHRKYPEDNDPEFERWFRDNAKATELAGKDRVYLPIFWTAYWCNNGYGKKDKDKRILQRFLDQLPRTKKYFSICQYDDGPMVDFKDIDIKIFGMSGGRIDYPIPLLCRPHRFEFPNIKKDIFCSFIGSDTHPVRKELVKEFKDKPECMVAIKKIPLKDYCEVLARSVFSLCPRGYGQSSFRIAESLQYSATPIYVSDSFVMPYNQNDLICVNVVNGSVQGLYNTLKKLDNERLQNSMQGIQHSFTYQGCKAKILDNI